MGRVRDVTRHGVAFSRHDLSPALARLSPPLPSQCPPHLPPPTPDVGHFALTGGIVSRIRIHIRLMPGIAGIGSETGETTMDSDGGRQRTNEAENRDRGEDGHALVRMIASVLAMFGTPFALHAGFVIAAAHERGLLMILLLLTSVAFTFAFVNVVIRGIVALSEIMSANVAKQTEARDAIRR